MWLNLKYIKGFYMSLGMFCAIPLPYHFWDEKYAALMVASIPLIGIIVGVLWWLATVLLMGVGTPLMMTAAILTLVPFYIAGFIHLDGYMDTSDALLSYRPLEDKLRILKDPHVGSFAVVMLAILFLLQFAAIYTIAESGRFLALLIAVPVISRCCSALSILTLHHMPQSNYVSMLAQNIGTSHKIFVILVAVAAVAFSFMYARSIGLIVSAAVIFGHAGAMTKAFKGFKGISGDLLGYSLVIGELCGLIALALLQNMRWV